MPVVHEQKKHAHEIGGKQSNEIFRLLFRFSSKRHLMYHRTRS